MAPEIAVAVEPEIITFYSWMGTDGTGRMLPSSQIIHISGGQGKLATDGTRYRDPVVEARFHNGMLRTSDPVVIAEVRRIAKLPGSCISEDKEEFYRATMTPQQLAARTAKLSAQKDEKLAEALEENSRLRRMLEEQGAKPAPTPRARPHA